MFTSVLDRNETGHARHEARTAFANLHQQGWFHQLWSNVTGHRRALLNLYEVQGRNMVQARSHAGVCLVPIERIRGSEGRCNDFDAAFRPLQTHSEARWVSVACARQADVPLPLVELVQVNDIYFVRDGHHRISVARWLGQQEIEAEVTVWHCRTTGAELSSQTPALPATRTTQRPANVLASLVTKAGERLLAVLQKVQPLTHRTLTQGS